MERIDQNRSHAQVRHDELVTRITATAQAQDRIIIRVGSAIIMLLIPIIGSLLTIILTNMKIGLLSN